jgi:hypothetical protein
MTADQYLIELSKKKDIIYKKFDDIIKSVSIENQKQKGGSNDISYYLNMYINNKLSYLKIKNVLNSKERV